MTCSMCVFMYVWMDACMYIDCFKDLIWAADCLCVSVECVCCMYLEIPRRGERRESNKHTWAEKINKPWKMSSPASQLREKAMICIEPRRASLHLNAGAETTPVQPWSEYRSVQQKWAWSCDVEARGSWPSAVCLLTCRERMGNTFCFSNPLLSSLYLPHRACKLLFTLSCLWLGVWSVLSHYLVTTSPWREWCNLLRFVFSFRCCNFFDLSLYAQEFLAEYQY